MELLSKLLVHPLTTFICGSVSTFLAINYLFHEEYIPASIYGVISLVLIGITHYLHAKEECNEDHYD